jgi:hypothetical protein
MEMIADAPSAMVAESEHASSPAQELQPAVEASQL